MTTTIQIEDDTWEMLKKNKQRGETFDMVVKKALQLIKLNKKATS
jgi:predicted CopG family antitoxin